MKTYAFDLKIYEPAAYTEIPFLPPPEMLTDKSTLKLGYHRVVLTLTEEKFEYLMAWAARNGAIMKVIGSEVLQMPR